MIHPTTPLGIRQALFLRRAIALGAISLLLWTVACSDDHDQRLASEVEALRTDLQELQNLRKEVEYLRASMARPPEPEAASVASVVTSGETQTNTEAQTSAGTQTTSNDQNLPILAASFQSADHHFSDDPFLGKPQPEVLLMAFIDYQCGPCRDFYQQTFTALKEEFVDSGKATLYVRDFPLSSNLQARNAAVLAHCAGEQGAYWPVFQLLFENPEQVDRGEFESLASKIDGLDQAKLKLCYGSGRYTKELELDSQDGIALGARGAPGFFVGRQHASGGYGGVFIRGAQPLRVLRAEIRKVLAANGG